MERLCYMCFKSKSYPVFDAECKGHARQLKYQKYRQTGRVSWEYERILFENTSPSDQGNHTQADTCNEGGREYGQGVDIPTN